MTLYTPLLDFIVKEGMLILGLMVILLIWGKGDRRKCGQKPKHDA